jgi:hypothetical protein
MASLETILDHLEYVKVSLKEHGQPLVRKIGVGFIGTSHIKLSSIHLHREFAYQESATRRASDITGYNASLTNVEIGVGFRQRRGKTHKVASLSTYLHVGKRRIVSRNI